MDQASRDHPPVSRALRVILTWAAKSERPFLLSNRSLASHPAQGGCRAARILPLINNQLVSEIVTHPTTSRDVREAGAGAAGTHCVASLCGLAARGWIKSEVFSARP